MQHRIIVDGSEIHYWTYGDDTKPAVFLVHGFTGSHQGFEYIIPKLKQDFYVIAPDLPGFGKSALGFTQWDVDGLAAEVNKFVAALQLGQKPFVVSHSLGGLVAASMLAQRPELFAVRSVFISPVATKIGLLDSRKLGAVFGALHYNIGKRSKWGKKLVASKRISRLITNLMLTTNDREQRRLIHQHHFKNLDYISSIDFYHRLHTDIVRRGVIDYQKQLAAFELLLIAGDRDNVTPLKGEKMLARELGAQLEIIPGVGHLAHYETPDAIAKPIVSFLE